jgi:hypothetical protein
MVIKTQEVKFLSVDKIETVLQNCTLQKVWDHFTKAQRKNITGWKAQFQVRSPAFHAGIFFALWYATIG